MTTETTVERQLRHELEAAQQRAQDCHDQLREAVSALAIEIAESKRWQNRYRCVRELLNQAMIDPRD